jgi:signal peptidase I
MFPLLCGAVRISGRRLTSLGRVDEDREEAPMKERKQKSVFREYAESIVIAILLAVIMRHFVVQAFKIPSGSMEQTLMIGDHILVNKFLYRFTSPKRFDVIVFKYPWEENRDFIIRQRGYGMVISGPLWCRKKVIRLKSVRITIFI